LCVQCRTSRPAGEAAAAAELLPASMWIIPAHGVVSLLQTAYTNAMRDLLRDAELRHAVRERLLHRAQQDAETLVIDELGLDHGACRIDIAVINGSIRGLEIKAEADTLVRLPRQVAAYGDVVSKATLVVATRHLEAALSMIPAWWGVVSAQRGLTQGVLFRRIRKERVNRNVNPLMLARLLWRPEVLALLRESGHAERTLRQPREVLYERLVAELPGRLLAKAVREALKSREFWRDHAPPS
jgi:hypothetical protein